MIACTLDVSVILCYDCIATGPCSSSPCQNGGTCSNIGTTDFNCDCPDDYNDGDVCTQCKTALQAFENRPFLRWNNFRTSWMFKQFNTCLWVILSTDQNPCDASPCRNGGSCQRVSYIAYTCSCSSGYIGDFCELKKGVWTVLCSKYILLSFFSQTHP